MNKIGSCVRLPVIVGSPHGAATSHGELALFNFSTTIVVSTESLVLILILLRSFNVI